MIDMGARVHIPQRNLYGRVVGRDFVPNFGLRYTILIETPDNSHREEKHFAPSVRLAVNQRGPSSAEVVSLPRGRVALRLAALHGVAL